MKKLGVFVLLFPLLLSACGCSSSAGVADDDKDLRAQFSKPKVDINSVPADQKAKVQGFIDHANEMRAKARASGAGK